MVSSVGRSQTPVVRPQTQTPVEAPAPQAPAQQPEAQRFRTAYLRDGFSANVTGRRGQDFRAPESIYRSGSPTPQAPSAGRGAQTLAEGQIRERRALLTAGDADRTGGTVGEVRVQGQYQAQVGANGGVAQAGGRVEVNAVRARAQLVQNDRFDANVTAQAGAAAELGGSVVVNRNTVMVQGQQGAFVGASVGAQANLRGEVGAVGARGEALFGLGARVGGHAGVENGRLRVGVDVGVAVGLGIRLRGSVEVDPAGVARAAGRGLSSLADGAARLFTPALPIRP